MSKVLCANEEEREAGEKSSAQSPTLPALYPNSPSSPVRVDPVRGIESIRVSPLLLRENGVDIGWPRRTQNRCPARGHQSEIVALS